MRKVIVSIILLLFVSFLHVFGTIDQKYFKEDKSGVFEKLIGKWEGINNQVIAIYEFKNKFLKENGGFKCYEIIRTIKKRKRKKTSTYIGFFSVVTLKKDIDPEEITYGKPYVAMNRPDGNRLRDLMLVEFLNKNEFRAKSTHYRDTWTIFKKR